MKRAEALRLIRNRAKDDPESMWPWLMVNAPGLVGKCDWCGGPFVQISQKRRFCSDGHRVRAFKDAKSKGTSLGMAKQATGKKP